MATSFFDRPVSVSTEDALALQVHCSSQEAIRLAVCIPDLWFWAAPVLLLLVLQPVQGRNQG